MNVWMAKRIWVHDKDELVGVYSTKDGAKRGCERHLAVDPNWKRQNDKPIIWEQVSDLPIEEGEVGPLTYRIYAAEVKE